MLVPKPGMIKDEKGLVNQPMVKRSCHDLIMTQSFEMRQKIKELTSLCSRRRKGWGVWRKGKRESIGERPA